jgi:hypothetical protein
MVTRRSRTGYVQFVNNAVVSWFSKKQGSIKTSTFGIEFVALKTAMEANRGLRYKLRKMGVPIDGSSYVFCDNQSVIANSSRQESLLKKKSNAIAYHAFRESCVMKEILICYVETDDNVVDIMTKVLPAGERRDTMVERLLYDITSGVEESHTPQTGQRVSKVSLGLKSLNYPPVETTQQGNKTNYKRMIGM